MRVVSTRMHTHATDALARRSDVARAGVHVGAPCHERAHHAHARGGGLNPFFAEGPFELLVQRIEAYRRPSPASASSSAATQQAPSGAHTESGAARTEWVDREEEEEEQQQQAARAKTDARSAGERAAAVAAADEAAELAARAAAGAAQAAQAAEAAEAAADVAAVLSGKPPTAALPPAPEGDESPHQHTEKPPTEEERDSPFRA
jgi:hypothetical protein